MGQFGRAALVKIQVRVVSLLIPTKGEAMDGKAQLIFAIAVLLIVIALIVALLSKSQVADVIAIIVAIGGIIGGWFALSQQARVTPTIRQ